MTATGAGGRCGLVTDLAARQMRGQRLAFGLLLGLGGRRRRLQLFDLDGDGRRIGFDLVVEQAALLGIEALGLGCELHALEQRVLVRELVDQDLLEDHLLALACDNAVSLGQLPHQRQQGRSHLMRLQGVKVVCGDHGRR